MIDAIFLATVEHLNRSKDMALPSFSVSRVVVLLVIDFFKDLFTGVCMSGISKS